MGPIHCTLRRVESSNLVACGYDRTQQILVVVFGGGATWAYEAVEPARWQGLVTAESKGRYLRDEVQAWRRGRKINPATIVQPEEE